MYHGTFFAKRQWCVDQAVQDFFHTPLNKSISVNNVPSFFSSLNRNSVHTVWVTRGVNVSGSARLMFSALCAFIRRAGADADANAGVAADGQVTLHKVNCLKHCTVFEVIIFSNQMGRPPPNAALPQMPNNTAKHSMAMGFAESGICANKKPNRVRRRARRRMCIRCRF
jgi:hypothetical protein